MKWSLAIHLPLIAAPGPQSLFFFFFKFFYPWLKLPVFSLEPRGCSVEVFSPQLYSLAALSRRRDKPEALWKVGPDVIPPSTGPMNAGSPRPATHGHTDRISMASGPCRALSGHGKWQLQWDGFFQGASLSWQLCGAMVM